MQAVPRHERTGRQLANLPFLRHGLQQADAAGRKRFKEIAEVVGVLGDQPVLPMRRGASNVTLRPFSTASMSSRVSSTRSQKPSKSRIRTGRTGCQFS